MEPRDVIMHEAGEKGIVLDDEQCFKIEQYGKRVLEANRRFNLTGFVSIEEIIHELVLKSIDPVASVDVPRGTRFCDLGSGAGFPGVPFAIVRPELTGFLVDSSSKKTGFISKTCNDLEIKNVNALCVRAEDMGKDPVFREQFGLVLSRAMASPYIVIETGSPLVKKRGLLYIYASEDSGSCNYEVLFHARELGMKEVRGGDYNIHGIRGENGILLQKVHAAGARYPRRYSAIKRDAKRLEQ